jgi:hypothetical protein
MSRYVFSLHSLTPDPQAVAEAEKIAKSMGVKIVRRMGGSMLLEAAPRVVSRLARAMPGWRLSQENGGYRVPERTPLQRARAAANSKS